MSGTPEVCSLCVLCVLCVSVVVFQLELVFFETTEAQRTQSTRRAQV